MKKKEDRKAMEGKDDTKRMDWIDSGNCCIDYYVEYFEVKNKKGKYFRGNTAREAIDKAMKEKT